MAKLKQSKTKFIGIYDPITKLVHKFDEPEEPIFTVKTKPVTTYYDENGNIINTLTKKL